MRVIVTGAAGALGKSVVARFVQAGGRVACLDRFEGEPSESCTWFLADNLANPTVANSLITSAVDWLGGVDALVHLVGAFDWKRVEQSSLDDWRTLYSANVETTLCVIQAVLPSLARDAAIVTVGAASAQPAGAGMAPYAAAKAGVARLSEALSQELKPSGIRINSVLPLIIDTPLNRAEMPDADFTNWTSPKAIADTIHFLASPASRAINGASVEVTNGA